MLGFFSSKDAEVRALFESRIPRRIGTAERINWEVGWFRQALYFYGKQHFAVVGNQIQERPAGRHEIRYKANFIAPLVMRNVAKIMRLNGRFVAAPESASMEHRAVALLSEQIFKGMRTSADYETEKYLAYIMAAVMGTSFLKVTYDPKKGDPKRFYLESKSSKRVVPELLLGDDEKQLKDREGLFQDFASGDAVIEATSSFQAWPDPASMGKQEHCRWFAQTQYLDPEVIGEAFNVDPADIAADDRNASQDRWEDAVRMMTSGISGQYVTFGAEEPQRQKRAWLGQMWERPCRAYPRGRFMVCTSHRVLYSGDNPYAGDKRGWLHIPFVKVDWIPTPLRYWSTGLVEQLISPQFRYNESRAKVAEFERVHGCAPTYMPKGSGVTAGQLVTKPGSVVEYNSAFGAPTLGPTPQLPAEVANNANRCLEEMQMLASASESENAPPGQLRSGIALSTMLKDRDLVNSLTQRNSLLVDRNVGRCLLTIVKLFFEDSRINQMRGDSGQWAVKAFRAADINNDLRVLGEPGEMETRDEADARLLDFIQAGALQPATNPQHAQIVLKALKYHTAEDALKEFTQHEELQEAEIRKMIAAPRNYFDHPYPVMEWENHESHMRVLERLFNNLEEWDALDADTKSVLAVHWKMHKNFVQMEQQQQLQMLQAAKGAPGVKGQASQAAR